ncbi:hypothetical protein [Paraburkholderia saeva]|uniref:hypothetical protein n=1 Tax=Paraburkholderia saeva TaxID=2777537 RepID=UPI001E53ADC2|nr:hypothetical protein [Paraburkholderia saeva]
MKRHLFQTEFSRRIRVVLIQCNCLFRVEFRAFLRRPFTGVHDVEEAFFSVTMKRRIAGTRSRKLPFSAALLRRPALPMRFQR